MLEAIPLACNMNAFDADQRVRYGELKRALFPRAARITFLENGLEIAHEADARTILELAEFATLERLCCPFLTFNLEIGPNQSGSKLRLTGPDGTATFLRHELGL
jgi:hypothetical protein